MGHGFVAMKLPDTGHPVLCLNQVLCGCGRNAGILRLRLRMTGCLGLAMQRIGDVGWGCGVKGLRAGKQIPFGNDKQKEEIEATKVIEDKGLFCQVCGIAGRVLET